MLLTCGIGCAQAALEGGQFGTLDADPIGSTPPPARPIVDPFAGSCAHTTVRAQPMPIELVFTVDTSGSMNDRIASGATKWEAVVGAFDMFFRAPGPGVSVGLQFFPLANAGAPRTCNESPECREFGPCTRFRACTRTGQGCASDADCGSNGPCALIGECSGSRDLCVPAGAMCEGAAGLCRELPGRCAQYESCNAGDYARLAVPVSPLPSSAWLLRESLWRVKPEGSTPTGPALIGALAYARGRVTFEPEKHIATVLVTDGIPTSCTPRAVADIAAAAAAERVASPSIPTYVIGVFSPSEAMVAQRNLDEVARAGSGSAALIVNTSQDVGAELLRALSTVRAATLACEYALPPDPSGKADLHQLNLRYTSSRGISTVIGHVPSEEKCHSERGGWYYGAAAADKTLSRVHVCPVTCGILRSDPGGRIDLVFGCKTVDID